MEGGGFAALPESPIPLESAGDVQRALAKCIRQVHAGSLDYKVGHCLIIGLGTLAKMMQEGAQLQALERVGRLEARRGTQPRPAATN